MNIVWLCTYPLNLLQAELNTVSGKKTHSASWIINLSQILSENKNIKLHIITHSSVIPSSKKLVKGEITFHIIKYSFPCTNRGFPSYLPLDKLTFYKKFSNEVLKLLDEIYPDIIHAHGTEHAYALIAHKSIYKAIVSIQGIITEYFKINPSFSFFLQIPFEKYSIKMNKNFGCRTNWDKNIIKRMNPSANIYYMPEAINPLYFKKSWNPNKNIRILFVGSLMPRKGIEILLEAYSFVIKSIPNANLVIVGTAQKKYQSYLDKIVNNNGMQNNICFLGQQNPEKIVDELAIATIFVLPTFIDNSPNSLAEAMAVGTPCIASNVGGIPSMIKDGFDGFLVEPGNPQKLAGKIISVIGDEEVLIKISTNARKTAIDRNYPEKVAQQTIKVYKQILESS